MLKRALALRDSYLVFLSHRTAVVSEMLYLLLASLRYQEEEKLLFSLYSPSFSAGSLSVRLREEQLTRETQFINLCITYTHGSFQ